MIIVAFTYGLLEGDLFLKLMVQYWINAEEMIRKVNHFLRHEVESAEKTNTERKATARGGRREEWTRQHHMLFINSKTHFPQNQKYN